MLMLFLAHSQVLNFSCTSSTRFCPNTSSEITCTITSQAIEWGLSGDIEDEITLGSQDPVGTNKTSDVNDDFTAIKTDDSSSNLKFTSLIEFDNSLTVMCADLAAGAPDSCIIMIYGKKQ